MPEDETPAVEQGTGVPMDQIPTDFRDYDHWRKTGELPTSEDPQPSATAPESAPDGEPDEPVKTVPDPEPEDDPESDEVQQPQRPSSRQRRIDRLTRQNAELQKRLEALEQKGVAPVAGPVEVLPPKTGAKPELKDYTTLESYTEALTEWKLDQREAARQASEEKRSAESAAKSLADSWTTREAAASKAHPDYRELMEATPIPQGPAVMAIRQALLEEESGAEILYWLASRPQELKRISALSPAKAILAIGKLAANFTAPSEDPKPRVSSAPRPPSPLPKGTGRVTENVYDDATAKDYKRWTRAREAQLKG